MKVAVVNASTPFARGVPDRLAGDLVRELSVRGHDVELIRVLFRSFTVQEVAESMFSAASLQIPLADRMISLRFPSYLVPHPSKVIWMVHQPGQVPELPAADSDDPGSPLDRLACAIRQAESLAFSEARSIYCDSAQTAELLRASSDCAAGILQPPAGELEESSGPYPSWDGAIEVLLS